MTSYQLTAFGAPLERVDREAAAPSGTEVLLRVVACGVCHSDVHIAAGYFDLGGGRRFDLSRGIRLPPTLGHEIVGEVVAAGSDADVTIGERRLVYPWIGCGRCATCSTGAEHLCVRPQALGAGRDGGFSDHVVVPHPRYLLGFEDLPAERAATYACAGLTAFSALCKAVAAAPSGPLLIVGAGGVGESAIRLARGAFGLQPAVAEIDARKRENARESGAGTVFDPRDDGARKTLFADTERGFAAAIDFVGSESSAECALALVRKGGTVVIVGLYGGALQLALPLIPLRAISIVGSYVGSLEELRDLLALARRGAGPQTHTERRPLADAQLALDALREGRVVGRTVLIPDAVSAEATRG